MTGNVSIRIDTRGLTEMINYFRQFPIRIQRAQEELDAALDATAETSRDLAHLHSGRLKQSQSHSSDHGSSSWTGEISYTGRGAAFEIQRGGDHSAYIDALSVYSAPLFEEALDRIFTDE